MKFTKDKCQSKCGCSSHLIAFRCQFSDGESDAELAEDDDFSKLYGKGPPSNPASFSYLNLTDGSYPLGGGGGGVSFDISPLSSPEKELGGKWS